MVNFPDGSGLVMEGGCASCWLAECVEEIDTAQRMEGGDFEKLVGGERRQELRDGMREKTFPHTWRPR